MCLPRAPPPQVGAIVATARGRVPPDTVARMLDGDRAAAPKNCGAPPSGLFLHSVEYGERDGWPGEGGPDDGD